MTVVTGSFNVPGQSGLTGFSGSLWWVPTARHNSGSGVVLPVPFIVQVDVNGTMTPITVDPTGPTWVWKVTEQFNGIAQNVVRYVQVPVSGTVAYKDLVDVDPNSLQPNTPVPGVVDGGTAALPNRFIQDRRDTAANWTAANPILGAGEKGYETDTKRQKIGDGTTAWNALGYTFDKPQADGYYAKFNAVRSMLRNQNKNLYDINNVMASPPTVTLEAASATITTGVVTKTPQQALIQGPTPIDNGFGYFYTSPIAGVAGQNFQPWAVEFTLDGTRVEFKYATNSTTKLRVLVNGQYTSLTSSTLAGGSGNVRYGLIDFAGVRAFRHIRIEFDGFMLFHSLRIDPTASLTASRRKGLTGLVMGDSYVAGTGADSAMSPWSATLGNLLGWGRTLTSGAPGTGYLKTNTLPKFRDRVATDVTALAPDVVVVSGGYNDYSTDTLYTPSQVGTEAGLLYDAIAAGLPNALVVAVSPFWTSDVPGANRLAIAAAIKAAAQARGLMYVDMLNPSPIITGTGKVGATTGTGNADLYVSSDGVHPTQAGHDYIALNVASAICSQLPSLAP